MISTQHLLTLQCLYREWREERWRNCLDGNNRLNPEREAKVITMLYEGIRFQEMCRRGIWKGTGVMVLGRLIHFLNSHPQFERPVCACGRALWHKEICPVWDVYHADAIKKGHETQRRQYEERKAADFFQMTQGVVDISQKMPRLCACGCGQETEQTLHDDKARGMKAGDYNRFVHGHYSEMKTRERLAKNPEYRVQYHALQARNRIKVEMMEFLRDNPGMDREGVLIHFRKRGYNKNSLSRMLNEELSFHFNFKGEDLYPKEVNVSRDDAFFETSVTANVLAASFHESIQYRTHHPCQSDW